MINNKALKLLRSALWNKPCDANLQADDWKMIVPFAHAQTLDGIMPDALQQLPKVQYPPMPLKMKMISRMLQVEINNKKMNEELVSFVQRLEKCNIPYVLLKGQGVASYYPSPLHRMPGDIDLYIPLQYFAQANECMLAYGGEIKDESRHHVDYVARGVIWELHHCILYFQSDKRNKQFMKLVENALKQTPNYVMIDGERIRVLPPVINVVMLLAHILDHFLCQGIGLRQLCDYALVLDGVSEQIDVKVLKQTLTQLSLIRAYRVFGQLCVDYLGLSSGKIMIDTTESDKRMAKIVMEDCIRGGNFGNEDHKGRKNLATSISYYNRFFTRLIKFGSVCPSESVLWPMQKFYRFITGKVHIDEKNSILKTN